MKQAYIYITLCSEQKAKAWIRLHGCASWSGLLFSACSKVGFLSLRPNCFSHFRDELKRLEDQIEPETVIAIVGATGEGKSSLINALLDHRSVLPTSGHRACTAVVVEVVGNAESDEFEADIEFRSKQVR